MIDSSHIKNNCRCYSVIEALTCNRDCEYQDYLVKEGIVISCDGCGHPGHTDSSGWVGLMEGERCFVYCGLCVPSL